MKLGNILIVHLLPFYQSIQSQFQVLIATMPIYYKQQYLLLMQKSASQEPFYSVEMVDNHYPFGQLKETVSQEQLVLIHKKLTYYSERQLEILKKMSQFLGNLDSEYLISLHHSEKGSDNKFHFYYQYAPLTLERWILDLGDDVLQELEVQMLNLASYLTQNGIRFKFDPLNLGLSKEIKVKYFLSQFAIDNDHKLANYKEAEAEIINFFSHFRSQFQNKEKEQPKNTFMDRKSADSANLFGSATTRESWEVKSNKSSNSAHTSMHKSNTLSEKIQNSKKKSNQILERLKNLKGNP